MTHKMSLILKIFPFLETGLLACNPENFPDFLEKIFVRQISKVVLMFAVLFYGAVVFM